MRRWPLLLPSICFVGHWRPPRSLQVHRRGAKQAVRARLEAMSLLLARMGLFLYILYIVYSIYVVRCVYIYKVVKET